jgi:hypothetical protein
VTAPSCFEVTADFGIPIGLAGRTKVEIRRGQMGLAGLTKGIRLSAIWSKYGLIVVGNIVFFILVYFISYRPHNEESRASELLSMAQSAETQERKETAVDLYEKILADYAATRSAVTARERLPILKKSLSKKEKPLLPPPPRCEEIDIEEMLRKGPAVYIATYVAKHFHQFPKDRAKLIEVISKYLKMSLEWQGVPLKQLKGESEFQNAFFQKQFFTVQPRCKMASDWIYDDFSVENANFFSWHHATLKLVVSQGGERAEEIQRAETIASGGRVDMLEFRVRSSGGPLTCHIEVKSDEGSVKVTEEI